jgi:hypothetical protein
MGEKVIKDEERKYVKSERVDQGLSALQYSCNRREKPGI